MQMNTGNSSLRLTTKDPFQFKKWHDALLASLHAVQQQPNMPAVQASGSLQQQFPPMAAEQHGATNQPEASQPSSSIRFRKPSLSLRSTASQFVEDDDTIERDQPMNQWESQLSLDGSLNCGGQMRWRKDKLLARGGGGSVFRGSVQLNSADWQRCVIKVIRLPMEAGADGCEDCTTGIRRAVDGEQNLCDLSHQNIVQFLGIVQTVDQFKVCLFMELLDGDTLESFIGGNPMTDQSQMRSICGQICSAMQYIHTRQPPVIHRDINGWNIMVLRGTHEQQQTDGPIVKLIDFGLSMKLKEAASHHSTISAYPKGTLNFMAPELLAPENEQDPARYSAKSDIWAFGCTVYLMVTGSRPHAKCPNMGSMACTLAAKHSAPDLPDGDGIRNALRDFYSRCTAWKREDRWSAERLLSHSFLLTRRTILSFDQ